MLIKLNQDHIDLGVKNIESDRTISSSLCPVAMAIWEQTGVSVSVHSPLNPGLILRTDNFMSIEMPRSVKRFVRKFDHNPNGGRPFAFRLPTEFVVEAEVQSPAEQ